MAEKEFLKPEKKHNVKIKYLLIIAILCLSFSVAFILRSYPIKYGFTLNEFDPFFDYRATQYIVDNGIGAYFKWHDNMSWYPDGRDIPSTSQSGLHLTAAILYQVFGMNSSLMDFTIWFPVIIGSASTILIFLLVRSITGSSVPGLIASIFLASSPAIIQRGNLGWFKSEPLGIFYGLGGTYLFVSALKDKKYKYLIPKAIFSGILLGLATTSWGGAQYFVIPIAIFITALAFVPRDYKNPLLVSVLFTISILIVAGAFPRPGMSFVFGLPGILLMVSTAFLAISTIVNRKSSGRKATRNAIIILAIFVIIGIAIISSGLYKTPSFRYLNAINPFISSQNKLVESVAEHFTPTIVDYFRQFSILIIFAGLGIWSAFKNKNNRTMIFALIIGLTGIYVSATFARLLVFASISITILSSIGIYETIRSITSIKRDIENQAKETTQGGSKIPSVKKFSKGKHILPYAALSAILIAILTIPMIYDSNTNWITSADVPTSIVNGGTNYRTTTPDWTEALNWISKNTPQNSTIASWWDYGYWITTLGNRTSMADNATINQTKIATIAKMFMSPEEQGLKIAKDLGADYILIYVVGQKLPAIDPTNNSPIYILGSGGDESKKHWFIRIGGFNEAEYLQSNGDAPKQKLWDSLFGHMLPFESIGYFNPTTGLLSPQYQANSIPFYVKDIKYPKGNTSQPLTLEYASRSFESNEPGLFFGVLLYKVNENFNFENNNNNTTSNQPNTNNTVAKINSTDTGINNNTSVTNVSSIISAATNKTPSAISPSATPVPISTSNSTAISNSSIYATITNDSSSSNSSSVSNNQQQAINTSNKSNNRSNNNLTDNNMASDQNNTAVIETTQGPIKIQFYPDVAPNHVKNFKDLAQKGFYDGVVFHRIVKGFVIQAGDPNTKNDSNRDTWGTGGPGYTIKEEFNDIPHERGVLSMARTSDPNSAGSQFFIVLNDSRFLDNQYTVFGKVIEGIDVVDKIANTTTNAMDQPSNSDSARINRITIQ
jgi:dolichyl-diphosphooligosaccharide--protein glycosyltransferase